MDRIIFEEIGQRLKYARELRYITLEEASKHVGVSIDTILEWETGKTEEMQINEIEMLAAYYDVSSMWVLGYDVSMERSIDSSKLDL